MERLLDQYEIDCPNCGKLLRNISKPKDRKQCPDCGAKDAVFIPYRRYDYEWTPDGDLVRIKEKKAL